MARPLVDIDVEIKAETELAVLVNDGDREAWLPRSQIEIDDSGDTVVVTLPQWLAEDKGLL